MSRNSKGTPGVTALERNGIAFELHSYTYTGEQGSIGIEAADALGVHPDRVFKTLIVEVDDGQMSMAILPCAFELDLKALARALGGKRAAMADVGSAQRVTGYVKGGISPLGQKRRLPSVIDRSACDHATILVSAGKRGLELELAPGDLARLLDATFTDILRPTSRDRRSR